MLKDVLCFVFSWAALWGVWTWEKFWRGRRLRCAAGAARLIFFSWALFKNFILFPQFLFHSIWLQWGREWWLAIKKKKEKFHWIINASFCLNRPLFFSVTSHPLLIYALINRLSFFFSLSPSASCSPVPTERPARLSLLSLTWTPWRSPSWRPAAQWKVCVVPSADRAPWVRPHPHPLSFFIMSLHKYVCSPWMCHSFFFFLGGQNLKWPSRHCC